MITLAHSLIGHKQNEKFGKSLVKVKILVLSILNRGEIISREANPNHMITTAYCFEEVHLH